MRQSPHDPKQVAIENVAVWFILFLVVASLLIGGTIGP